MKKLFAILLIGLTSLTVFTGCTSKNVEGNLEDLMTKVYEELPQEETPMMLQNVEVNAENMEYYLGVSDIDIKEALASESATGSIAHSVVLVRLNDGKDVNDVMKKIKENVNPRKWICVGVEESEVVVKNKGDLIILIMSKNYEKLEKGFDNL